MANIPPMLPPSNSLQVQDEWPEPTGIGGFTSSGESGGGAPLLRLYLDSVLRWKWLVLVLALVGLVAGYGVSRLQKPTYTASSTIWLEGKDSSPAAELDPIGSADLLQPLAWVQLLRTFAVLEPVVLEQYLFVESKPQLPDSAFMTFKPTDHLRPGLYTFSVGSDGRSFRMTDIRGVQVAEGRLGTPFGSDLGFTWTPPARYFQANQQVELRLSTTRDAARTLGLRLDTRVEPEGAFLQINYTADNPFKAAAVLDAVTSRFLDVATDLKRARLDELTLVLSEQLRSAERNLREAEIALEGFRVQTITLPSDQPMAIVPGIQQTRDPAISSFFDMRIEREQQRRDREAIERVLAQSQGGEITIDALTMIPAVQSSPELSAALETRMTKRAELRALQQRYTDEYPPIRDLQAEVDRIERQTIPTLARQLATQLMLQERQMDERLDAASDELRRIPPRAIEEARLQRQVEIASALFTTLKQRFEEARLAAESSIPDVRMLDVPTVPYAPAQSPFLTILLGGFGGLGLGVFFGLVSAKIDPKLRYPEQVATELGLPIIGAITHVPSSGKEKETLARQAAEAFREIRLSISEALPVDRPIVLTVTSPESGDGKSFVAINLAMSFAKQRIPTLLIDGDIRRGHLHRRLNLQRGRGLTDLLAGKVTREEVLHATEVPWLHFIQAGTRTSHGPELLTTNELPKLIRSMVGEFPVIIVDTPPLGAGIDAYVFGVATEHMVVVLRTNQTNRVFASAKLGLLDRLPIRIIGAVLNGLPKSNSYRYYSYLPDYGVEEEEVPAIGSGVA